jgi:uncharacterized protein YggU (UPF0235/DUF167 family)
MTEACPVRLSASSEGTRFGVHVKPRASRSAVIGVREGLLDCAVAAPPVDGEANAELCVLIASVLGLKKREVEIRGATPALVAERLVAALAGGTPRGRK